MMGASFVPGCALFILICALFIVSPSTNVPFFYLFSACQEIAPTAGTKCIVLFSMVTFITWNNHDYK